MNKYKVQIEVIYESVLDFSIMNITKDEFEKMSFTEKNKIIKKYNILKNKTFEQCTDIEILSKCL